MDRGPIDLECREMSSKILVYERGHTRKGSMNRQHLTFLFEHHTKLLVKTKPPRGPLPVRCKRLRITCGSSRPAERQPWGESHFHGSRLSG